MKINHDICRSSDDLCHNDKARDATKILGFNSKNTEENSAIAAQLLNEAELRLVDLKKANLHVMYMFRIRRQGMCEVWNRRTEEQYEQYGLSIRPQLPSTTRPT
jgi:hypothetical protein